MRAYSRGDAPRDQKTGDPVTVEGTVETVVFHNEETFYTVLELVTGEGYLITAVGKIPYAAEGEQLILHGHWIRHAEYGDQLSVVSFEKQLPRETEAILRYLSSRVIKGIGPVTAGRIVKRYGADTFDVIENHPEWLAELPGISSSRAAEIHKSFAEQSGVRSLMMLCRDYISPAAITEAYGKWGSGAAELVKRDPYCLCELSHTSFERVDALAISLGIDLHSASRIRGGLGYLLEYNAAGNGHTCLPREKLIEAAAAHLQLPHEEVEAALVASVECGALRQAVPEEGPTLVGLKRLMDGERYIVDKLQLLESSCAAFGHADVDAMVARLEEEWGITYADEQYQAIRRALERGVLILTGGPGTGKTTVIRALLRLYESAGLKTALAAPTGRAAKRMSEATGCEAKTIHRMLEMERGGEGEQMHFNRDAGNPLDEKVVIVDEASMIDVPLMEALLRAMKRGARLLLIGDADQLPSVGAGNVLCDLLKSEVFATVRLTKIYRQASESLIVTNAHCINRGELPEMDVRDKDFFFLPCREENALALIADLVSRRLPKAYGEDFREGIQIITPSRKGRAGTEALNRHLQQMLNPPSSAKRERPMQFIPFREGDRIMQIRNNYEITWTKHGIEGTGVFNGDIGVIEQIDTKAETLRVRFDDDRVATYEGGISEELEHAYAITVHKSQGSEYPCVIIPLCHCPPMLLSRNLLYTAVTRARRMVIMVGRRDIAEQMIQNDRQVLRYTTLYTRARASIE